MAKQILVFILLLTQIIFSLADTILQLPNGQIQGVETATVEDNAYFAFEKIPYATPPVGNLRFKPPEPATNWDGVLNTTHIDVACYQAQMGGPSGARQSQYSISEDCLYLNVYTPTLPTEESTELLPVMVYIFGGAYIVGWSADYRPDLFVDNNVLLVTLNYRLGVFGFISTQDEVIPGNNGLKDQLMALQWVHDNIAFFGGDPDMVTIFGQSAGGGSCAYHLLDQNSKGLISGAILESGTFLSPGMYQRDSRNIAFGVGAVLNSTFETSEDSQALYEFLLTVDADDLMTAQQEYSNSASTQWSTLVDQGALFAPVIEVENSGAIVTEKMYGLLKSGNILPIPTMMGFTSEESILGKNDPDSIKTTFQLIDENLEYIVPNDMKITDLEERKSMGALIREIYTGGEPFANHLGAGIRYSSDNTLTRAMHKHAELFSTIAPIYFYQFSYDGDIGGIDAIDWGDGAGYVGHTEELNYLFCAGSNCNDDSYPESDLLTRRRLIKLWTNFGKYRNPTPESDELLQNVTWPQLSIEDGDFFYLNIAEDLTVMNHPKEESYEGWTGLYDSLGYDDFDSY